MNENIQKILEKASEMARKGEYIDENIYQ